MNDGLRSPELFHHLLDHSETYRAIIVSPYLFWTTFAPARSLRTARSCAHVCMTSRTLASSCSSRW